MKTTHYILHTGRGTERYEQLEDANEAFEKLESEIINTLKIVEVNTFVHHGRFDASEEYERVIKYRESTIPF